MRLHKGLLVFVYAVILSGTAAIAACCSGIAGAFRHLTTAVSRDATSNSSSGGSSGSGSSSGVIGMFGDGSTNDAALPPDPSDPQPKICTENDGGMEIVQQVDAAVYGSIECPSDKNLQNCPCSPLGATAACWTGTRATRNVGQCKDGTTTCVMQSENGNRWGQCMGEVLPDPSADAGAPA